MKHRNVLAAVTIAAAAAAAPVQAQFGGLLRQINPGGLLHQVVPQGNNTAAPGDLLQLLSQSVESIDEPREIEIGRQLASVLLGSKPLHPDPALQRYVNRLGRWISLQSERP
ncbi:MAG: peptidase, partial [Ramlibacter sp.]|nr:peptidase [Ramlibacter sp.]